MEYKNYKTLFILDWDDTLFPTNWLLKNGIDLFISFKKDQYIIYFQHLDRILTKFLKRLLEIGDVIVITNATLEWIKVSSIIMPSTSILLKNIKIISARNNYKHKSNNMTEWKILAFKDVFDNELDENVNMLNIISVGDAEHEYRALIELNCCNHNIKKYLKSVRFMRDPTHEILIDQIELLYDNIYNICNKMSHLDLIFATINNSNI